MRILFTGTSSFTGHWFVRSLAGSGHEVTALLTGSRSSYEGVRQKRLELLAPHCRLVENAPFGSNAFLALLKDNQKFDLLCHHWAEVRNYRSAEFDPLTALDANCCGVREVLISFRAQGGKAVLLTGTVGEPEEGGAACSLRLISPYGLSKSLTHQVFQYYAESTQLALGKFVIPNPFGPLEEPRFTAYLMRTWRSGKSAEVKTPDYIRDNIHVDLLASAYRVFAEQLVNNASAKPVILRPSGYVESQGAFAQRFALEMRARLVWACELMCAHQTDFSEPMQRTNNDPATQMVSNWNESMAWDNLAEYYRNTVE